MGIKSGGISKMIDVNHDDHFNHFSPSIKQSSMVTRVFRRFFEILLKPIAFVIEYFKRKDEPIELESLDGRVDELDAGKGELLQVVSDVASSAYKTVCDWYTNAFSNGSSPSVSTPILMQEPENQFEDYYDESDLQVDSKSSISCEYGNFPSAPPIVSQPQVLVFHAKPPKIVHTTSEPQQFEIPETTQTSNTDAKPVLKEASNKPLFQGEAERVEKPNPRVTINYYKGGDEHHEIDVVDEEVERLKELEEEKALLGDLPKQVKMNRSERKADLQGTRRFSQVITDEDRKWFQ